MCTHGEREREWVSEFCILRGAKIFRIFFYCVHTQSTKIAGVPHQFSIRAPFHSNMQHMYNSVHIL